MKKGLLIVVSGPSGSGKGTVNAKLLQSDNFAFSVSATTRAPRQGEVDGVNYYYITREEFERRIKDGEMLEYTTYCGNYYGTPLREAIEVLESGKNLILEIEVEGALNVKRRYPEAVLIMLLPPSFAVQEARLRGRCSEAEDVIQRRLARTREELTFLPSYDYVVYNYDNGVDACADDIRAIVRAEQCSNKRHSDAFENYFHS
ncbi:MAG: guanylate kinase [Clostridia bacterium]|nr:guanylate kinase [Clostridia bacterium]